MRTEKHHAVKKFFKLFKFKSTLLWQRFSKLFRAHFFPKSTRDFLQLQPLQRRCRRDDNFSQFVYFGVARVNTLCVCVAVLLCVFVFTRSPRFRPRQIVGNARAATTCKGFLLLMKFHIFFCKSFFTEFRQPVTCITAAHLTVAKATRSFQVSMSVVATARSRWRRGSLGFVWCLQI